MTKKWKEWHTLLGWLMSVKVTPEEVILAVRRYIHEREQDPQLELPLKRA